MTRAERAEQRAGEKSGRRAAALLVLELACQELARHLLKKPTAKAVREFARRMQLAALEEVVGKPADPPG